MRGQPFVFNEFQGGVNKEAAPYAISEDQSRDALNVVTTPVGTVKKRNGFDDFGTPTLASGGSITNAFAVHTATKSILLSLGTKLGKFSTGGVYADLKTGLTNNLPWSFIQAPVQTQGPVYMVNGTDTPQYWDGSAASTSNWTANTGSLSNGKYIIYHENRVYIAGVAATPNTLYWSDIVKPRDWASPNGGSTQLDPEDGQEITGLGKVGPYLIIFKGRKSFLLTDSNTGAYRRISDDMGCASHKSIASTEEGTFFLTSDRQICVTDGNQFNVISNPVKPILNLVSGPSLSKAAAIHKDKNYYISVSTSSVNDIILHYDMENQSWWIHKIYYADGSTTGVNAWTILEPSTTSTLYAVGGDTATASVVPLVYEAFKAGTYQDLVNFDWYWDTPWHVFDQPHIRKGCREIRVDALGTFELATTRSFQAISSSSEDEIIWEIAEENSGGTFGGEGTFGGSGTFGGEEGTITERRYYTPGINGNMGPHIGRAWSLRFSGSHNQDTQIYSYTMAMDQRTD